MLKRLGGILAALILGGAGAFAIAVPAQAQTNLEICNSVNSVGPIKIFSSNWPNGYTLITDRCNVFGNADGSVRVDPDPELGPDVDSTLKGLEGSGYYACDPGEGLINPPNDTGGRYWKANTNKGSC